MKTKEEQQLQSDWERYKNRLRDHWRHAIRLHPIYHFDMRAEEYVRLVERWYADTYLSEPMSPGQEYANDH